MKLKMNQAFIAGLIFKLAHFQIIELLSDLLNLHQVANFVNHTQDLGSSFYFFGSIQLFQTQGDQGLFLTLGSVDTAFNLCDLNLFHDVII